MGQLRGARGAAWASRDERGSVDRRGDDNAAPTEHAAAERRGADSAGRTVSRALASTRKAAPGNAEGKRKLNEL